jgi:pimeloyl-ACP methyl ester carboxylesterase
MSERAITFGPHGGLIGIVTEPDRSSVKENPVVIILNSGLLHRIGPYRLSVDMARRLASSGFRVLRFDLSGIGDSRMRLSKASKKESIVADIQASMDALSGDLGATSYVLMGLCSGSDNAQHASVADKRVVGVVHLDGFGFRNRKYYLNHYGSRLLSPKTWTNKLASFLQAEPQEDAPPEQNLVNRDFPSRKQATRNLATLVQRKTCMLYVYTWGAEDYNNYKEQFQDTFFSIDFHDLLDLEYYPFAEHTYPKVKHREKVVERILDWMNQNFS